MEAGDRARRWGALDRAVSDGLQWLLARQRPDGSWSGRFLASATATGQYVALKRQLGCTDRHQQRAVDWLLSHQNESGGWGYRRGLADVPVVSHFCLTAVASVLPPEHPALVTGREYLRSVGPIDYEWQFRTHLAYWGVHVEERFRPLLHPLLLYAVSNKTRWSSNFLRAIGNSENLLALRILHRRGRFRGWHRVLQRRVVDALWQDRDLEGPLTGSWCGGDVAVTADTLSALVDAGCSADSPVVHQGMDWLDSCVTPEGGLPQVLEMDIWETSLAALLLQECELGEAQAAAGRAVAFLARAGKPEDGTYTWDSNARRTGLTDFDDTSFAALARWRGGAREGVRRLADYIVSQGDGGSWTTFPRAPLLMRLSPLKDTPYIVPSLDVTCHVTTVLAEVLRPETGAVRAGSSWILKKQAADGSWSADWAMRKTYGTMCAVEALVASGVPARHDAIRRAVQWLESAQNQDGGWGEDWDAQPAASTVEQTAYALICLADTGFPPYSFPFSRGLDFVLGSQEYDGRWPPSQTGSFLQRITGAYNTDHYPTIYALRALLAAQKRLHSAGGC